MHGMYVAITPSPSYSFHAVLVRLHACMAVAVMDYD